MARKDGWEVVSAARRSGGHEAGEQNGVKGSSNKRGGGAAERAESKGGGGGEMRKGSRKSDRDVYHGSREGLMAHMLKLDRPLASRTTARFMVRPR